MKQKLIFLSLSLTFLTLLYSCTAGGAFLAHNTTSIELSDSNYQIVAKNLEGSSKAEYLIGMSYSSGFIATTFALVRVGGSAKLYDDAVRNLWDNYREKYGDTEGKKLALVNVRYDTDILNLFVYTQTKLYLNADVIEFEE
jgi:hypothetical protein